MLLQLVPVVGAASACSGRVDEGCQSGQLVLIEQAVL